VTPSFVVRLQTGPDLYLAPYPGDPCGRTYSAGAAKRYGTPPAAERALAKAREFRPFANAVILPWDEVHK
jgi:hypothetical protein